MLELDELLELEVLASPLDELLDELEPALLELPEIELDESSGTKSGGGTLIKRLLAS